MSDENTIRAFVAVRLLPSVQERLAQIQNVLKRAGADVKWVRPENIHLTLRFLGNVSPQKIRSMKKSFPSFYENLRSFELTIDGLGAFPNTDRPRIVWAGIAEGKQKTLVLAERTEQGLNRLGFPKEKRPFEAHVTLGRTRSGRHIEALSNQLTLPAPSPAVDQKVSSVELIKSTLTADGPVYETLAEALLI